MTLEVTESHMARVPISLCGPKLRFLIFFYEFPLPLNGVANISWNLVQSPPVPSLDSEEQRGTRRKKNSLTGFFVAVTYFVHAIFRRSG